MADLYFSHSNLFRPSSVEVLLRRMEISCFVFRICPSPSSVVRLPSSCIRFPAVTHPNIRHRRIHLPPKSRSAKKWFKKCSFLSIFVQFLLKNAKKCKFLLIFTPIFEPKTNKSYKNTLFTTANHPIFQKTLQKPLFS